MKGEAFMLRVIEKLKSRNVDRYGIIQKRVTIDKKTIDLGKLIKKNHIVRDVFIDVITEKPGAAISLGPWGAVEGYIDTLPISEPGVISPGPAVIVNDDGDDEVIGKTRGSLLAHGKKNVYIPCIDVSGVDKPIIITAHGDCDGAEICVYFDVVKIGG